MTKKNGVLMALLVVAFLDGAATQYLMSAASRVPIQFAFALVGITLYFAWYYLDSDEIGYQRGKLLNIAVIALGIVALPYYFFRSRGLKKGLVYTALFLIVAISWSALQTVGAYAVYYGLKG